MSEICVDGWRRNRALSVDTTSRNRLSLALQSLAIGLMESATARSERLLIKVLQADMELALTFLRTAAIEAGTDAEHGESALSKARTVLESIRRFQGALKTLECGRYFWIAHTHCKPTLRSSKNQNRPLPPPPMRSETYLKP